MSSKLHRAGEILSEEGPKSLLRESGLYVLRNTSFGNEILLKQSKKQVQCRMAAEENLDDVLDTVLEVQPGIRPYHIAALQLREEFRELIQFVGREQPRTVMEIGTANGGTLYTWCRSLPSVSDVISIDLPEGDFGGGYPKEKTRVYRSFAGNKNLHFVRGNSHDERIFERVRDDILGTQIDEQGIDFLFIDGDHTYEGVQQDFEMYKDLVNDGGIIAFHDIVETRDSRRETKKIQNEHPDANPKYFNWSSNHSETEVHQLWQELVTEYETVEFIQHPAQTAYGIGVISL